MLITNKKSRFERVTCLWCGTDRRGGTICARGPACKKEAESQDFEYGFKDHRRRNNRDRDRDD